MIKFHAAYNLGLREAKYHNTEAIVSDLENRLRFAQIMLQACKEDYLQAQEGYRIAYIAEQQK